MYLKRLELQGFKSFAPRTSLEFSPGITAIVGPNGSGKSNIADAIRWVLGEQSMRQLRGKKSDDIIFAGGQGRAPMQMAEVGLVLDNSAGWLPTEHTEVTAARRSFRSGESEYLVNGQRVRLRDLLLLLAQARIGHDSYTVIGQGMVDQALSLRAEERRGLFEDAAGIRQFQSQRTDAEQKLTLTQSNLSRLRDILGEIEPRLGPLAEQARRAREYSGARDDLRRLLRTWYAWQWRELLDARERATAAESAVAEHLETLHATLAEHEIRTSELRAARDTAQSRVAELRRTRGETTGRVQALERDLAVAHERRASLERQAADLAGEQGLQESALEVAEAHAGALDDQLLAAETAITALAARLEDAESSQHAARQEREREEARLRAAQRDAVQAQARLGAAQTELGRLQRQLGERTRALAARQDALAAAQQRLEKARATLAERKTAFEAARREVEGLVGQREELTRDLTTGQAELDDLRTRGADAQRERRTLADRLALLRDWERTHGGYPAGVGALLAAQDQRPPFRDVVARLIRALDGCEAAVEAALGPHLQAIVTESQRDAFACSEWLAERGAGHALFVWPTAADRTPTATRPPASVSVRGPIGNCIEMQAELEPVLGALLDGVWLVDDLDAAMTAAGDPAAWPSAGIHALVAPDGRLAHAAGWLHGGGSGSGGQAGADAGTLLARERELRQLPTEIERWEAEVADLGARQSRTAQVQQERRERSAALAKEVQRAEARAQELAREVAGLQRDEERAQSDVQLTEAMAEQLAGETAGVEQEVDATIARVAEQEAAQQEAADRVLEVQDALDELTGRNQSQVDELAQQRTQLAVKQQEAKALTQRADQLRAQARELGLQIERRAERVQVLAAQRAQLDETSAQQEAALAELRTTLRAAGAELQQQEAALAALERDLTAIDRDQAVARQELAAVEDEYRRRMIEAQRARDAVEALAHQVREELSALDEAAETPTDAPTADEQVDDVARLFTREPADAQAETERLSPEEAARMRRQIDQLRNRLRHLGGYDPEAPQAYEELKTRFEFLSTQVRDMEQASTNLRTVIAELDATMRRQFAETFQAVNLRFQRHFTTLFNGGAARLELTAPRRASDEDDDEPEDATTPVGKAPALGGIEVFVQIPGKRVQDLSLLSGGERAMVSAALLFALLETNPPPFCLLDEVDAALDEANVVRFCEILRTLSEQTQFVVITHNRVTMTHAAAIYGVSMGPDSVSRVLSMRLAEVKVGR